MKSNQNQVFFLLREVKLTNCHGLKTMKEFFDPKQFTLNKDITSCLLFSNKSFKRLLKETGLLMLSTF